MFVLIFCDRRGVMQVKESSGLYIRKYIFLSVVLGMAFPAFNVRAEENKSTEMSSKVFSLHLGGSRVVYDPAASSGAVLRVSNDHDYPILVQSEVLREDKKAQAPFVVTPPLFRLDGRQSSHLRIVRVSGDFPADRESLQWICVKGIPPKDDDIWVKEKDETKADKVSLQVRLVVSNCIKLFVRPAAVKGQSDEAAGRVTWQRIGNRLKGDNPTPFYINLSKLTVGGKAVKDHEYIAPFSSREYTLPTGASGKVQWTVITDYGGTSKLFEADLKG